MADHLYHRRGRRYFNGDETGQGRELSKQSVVCQPQWVVALPFDLETKVGAAEVIEPPTSGVRVTFGSTVLLEDEAGKEVRYQIVGSDEAEPPKGRISILAPLARTLIGKSVGDTVTAQLPGGKKTFEILKANFPWE